MQFAPLVAMLGGAGIYKGCQAIQTGAERASGCLSSAIDRGCARLAESAVQMGDLASKQAALAIIHAAHGWETTAVGESRVWLRSFDRNVEMALDRVDNNVAELATMVVGQSAEWQQLVREAGTQINLQAQRGCLILGVLSILHAFLLSEFLGRMAMTHELWDLLVQLLHTKVEVTLLSIVKLGFWITTILVMGWAVWRFLKNVADNQATLECQHHIMQGMRLQTNEQLAERDQWWETEMENVKAEVRRLNSQLSQMYIHTNPLLLE